MKKKWEESIKEQARTMRRNGASYGEITKTYKVAKSTLFEWVKKIEKPNTLYHTNHNAWFASIREKAAEANKKKRQREIDVIIDSVKEEVEQWHFLLDKNVQKSILSILYWAEGQKLPERGAPVKFANTDPRLILLFVKLITECYQVDLKKLKIGLYIHWYHKETVVRNFWKKLLGVHDSQFRKIYRKRRHNSKRFRKNFMGICFVIYQDVDLRQRIVHTAYEVQKYMVNGYNT